MLDGKITFLCFSILVMAPDKGGVLSPRLFARYIRDLLHDVVSSGVGCNVGGVMFNILAYADDIVLLAPSWRGLQILLDILYAHIGGIDMLVNANKSVCMVFNPKVQSKTVSKSFPLFSIGSNALKFVNCFKYLGHKIMQCGSDDDDIQREICNMFVRTNIVNRRFSKCSREVKIQLFKSYCLCLYDVALWKHFTVAIIGKMRSCYNRCIKIFFGYKRMDSMTNILIELGLPNFDVLLERCRASFVHHWAGCDNILVRHLQVLVCNIM